MVGSGDAAGGGVKWSRVKWSGVGKPLTYRHDLEALATEALARSEAAALRIIPGRSRRWWVARGDDDGGVTVVIELTW